MTKIKKELKVQASAKIQNKESKSIIIKIKLIYYLIIHCITFLRAPRMPLESKSSSTNESLSLEL